MDDYIGMDYTPWSAPEAGEDTTEFDVDELGVIWLGRQGENLVREITIDCTAWLEQLPGCTLAVVGVRPGERELYEILATASGGVITWPVASQDTAIAGCGMGEVRALLGEQIKKSRVFRTRIRPSLEGGTVTPVTPPDWAVAILGSVEAAEAAAESAAESAYHVQNVTPPNETYWKIGGITAASGGTSTNNNRLRSDAIWLEAGSVIDCSVKFALFRYDAQDTATATYTYPDDYVHALAKEALPFVIPADGWYRVVLAFPAPESADDPAEDAVITDDNIDILMDGITVLRRTAWGRDEMAGLRRDSYRTVADTGIWETGVISGTTGESGSANAKYMRTIGYLPDNAVAVSLPDGFRVILYGYDPVLGFQGFWKNGGFVVSSASAQRYRHSLDIAKIRAEFGYRFRLVVDREDGGNVDVQTDAANVKLTFGPLAVCDRTLTEPGVPADAKAVGDILAGLLGSRAAQASPELRSGQSDAEDAIVELAGMLARQEEEIAELANRMEAINDGENLLQADQGGEDDR